MKFINALLLTGFLMLGGIPGFHGISAKNKTKAQLSSVFKINPEVPKKRALLVGISKYHRGKSTDWWNLNTDYDIELLADVLKRKFNFDEVAVLSDVPLSNKTKANGVTQVSGEPTGANILKAFRDKLITSTEKNDIVYFHFSGHGMPVPDDNNDEIDGSDETIVPIDYVSQKDGSKNIRDDEIAKLLDELKLKQPANVTISFDSCFSGSATRGDELVSRGGDPLNLGSTKRGTDEKSASGLAERGEGLPNNYVFLSAASQTQTAKEIVSEDDQQKPIGVFTYGLVRAFENAGPQTTYRDIYERVNDFVGRKRPNQTPQVEGKMDQVLMKGTALPPDKNIVVKLDGDKIMLQAGQLQGITKGSKFELYPAGTKRRKQETETDLNQPEPLGTAFIEKLEATTSELKLEANVDRIKLKDGDNPLGKLNLGRAFEIEHNYDTVLKIVVEDIETIAGGKELMTELRKQELADLSNPNDKTWNVKIRKPFRNEDKRLAGDDAEKDFSGVILQRPDGTIIARVKEGVEMAKQVQDALERESRWLVIKSLPDSTDKSMNVEFRLIPVEVETGTREVGGCKNAKKYLRDKPSSIFQDENGNYKVTECEYVMLELRNTGEESVYVTILDLTPDGKIKPVFPHPAAPRDNLLKKSNEWVRIQEPYIFAMTKPYGQESFRLIATREQTDFSPLLDPETLGRGDEELNERGKNAARSPLGKILRKTQQGKRGDLAGEPSSWATTSVTFSVVPLGKPVN